ncbi:hypothetical protein ACWDBO_51650 [Streptomyces mirabilis]|uniref:hypothetical protein n=1 Tax=Streptomyces mirabilis TaxID=68239 RepID=UPI00331BC1A3
MAGSARPTVHSVVRFRNRHRTAALLLALSALTATASCSSGGDTADPTKSSSPSPTKSADPDAAQKAKVLEAYRGMVAAESRTYKNAKLDPVVEKYAGNKVLADIKATLFYYQQQGVVMQGEMTHDPKITGIDTTAKPMKATLTDCVDSSKYDKTDAKTGKVIPVKASGPRRHVNNATAIYSGGKWVIWTADIDRERTC